MGSWRDGVEARAAAVLVGAMLALACASEPAGDPAGTPGQALVLRLAQPVTGVLDCSEGDCVDWFRFQLPKRGTLRVRADAETEAGRAGEFSLALADAGGRVLHEARSSGGRLRASWPVVASEALVRVVSRGGAIAPGVRYELALDLDPAGPAPTARPSASDGRIPIRNLETGSGGERPATRRDRSPRRRDVRFEDAVFIGVEGDTVLLGRGGSSGVRIGQRGRLRDGGRVLAGFQVIEVFEEGSRARIVGRPEGDLGAARTAELEIRE